MLESGQLLAHYRLSEKLGQGGMGVVWKAVDTKLDREVAIKLLPEQFAADPERLGRFEREAKLLASLNHRNIAAIYGVDEATTSTGYGKAGQVVRFLVMELVEGEDLAMRLTRGAIPVDETLDICHQLARALENAHEKGILHRDLKPANVRISHEGHVKVLDFGLAKAFDSEPQVEGNPALSPTLTSVETRAGIILGTAAYMSPEQARGKPLDKRTDIWAFGSLLYECLTGKSPFQGETVTDTLASIVKTPADWSLLPDGMPPRVRELLQRCLEKDVKNRLRDIGEARIELQRSIGATSDLNLSAEVSALTLPRSFSSGWLLATALIGAVVGIGLWAMMTSSETSNLAATERTVRSSIVFPSDLDVLDWNLSPDGGTLAYIGRPKADSAGDDDRVLRLYLRALNAFDSRAVEGSEGLTAYFFSPDGRWLGLRAPVTPRSTKHRLLKVPVDGSSPPLVLLDWHDEWSGAMLWLPDGDIVVGTADRKAVVRIPSAGGEPGDPLEIRSEGFEGAVSLDSGARTLLPDGVHVLGRATTYTERGYDDSVALLNLETGAARIVIENGSSATYSSTGHVVFSRSDAVLAIAFDLERLEPVGNTVAIQAGFRALAGYGDTYFSLSADGSLVHWPGGIYGDKRQLVFMEHDAANGFRLAEFWSDDLRFFEGGIIVSRDGLRLAVSIANDAGLYETWISDMDRPRLSRFAHAPGRDCTPSIWTPDGDALVYTCQTTEETVVFLRRIDSNDEPQRLMSFKPPDGFIATAFLPDRSAIVLTHLVEGKRDLVLLPLGAEASEPAIDRPWLEDAGFAAISVDGRWLAYLSDVSGRTEVYLRPLRENGALGREIPVSTNGGGTLFWNDVSSPMRLMYHSQREIYFVEVNSSERVSAPKLLGDINELAQKTSMHAHMPDGRWLAALNGEGEELPDRVNLVLNWTAELKRRMAAR